MCRGSVWCKTLLWGGSRQESWKLQKLKMTLIGTDSSPSVCLANETPAQDKNTLISNWMSCKWVLLHKKNRLQKYT